ncbi:MAG TPA: hypothetical protein PKA86_04575 [Bacteroidia bacterium]|nr:hypothetical protein [Bacteroidia bacterium]
MDAQIENFIGSQKNMTLCTSINNTPECANCFYTFMPDGDYLIFKSKKTTGHVSHALVNNKVAGTILPDISKIGSIKGIQFSGVFLEPQEDLLEKAKKIYYSKFPLALGISGELWLIKLTYTKMTDNTLGFGKKLIWENKN